MHKKIESPGCLIEIFSEERPDMVIHLAAQAGVRHSIANPRAYLDSNIIGTFELLEARYYPPQHMLLASTSSVYGSNTKMPYQESDKADQQMSFMLQAKRPLRVLPIAILICLNYQLRCLDFLPFMVPGAVQIWPCSSLQKQYLGANQLMFTTMEI